MDKNLENIVNRVANRNSVTPLKAKLALEAFFKTTKQLLQRDDMPTVMVHGFGRFVPDEYKIKRRLITLSKHLKEGKLTQEEYNLEKEHLTGILTRLQENKHIRNK